MVNDNKLFFDQLNKIIENSIKNQMNLNREYLESLSYITKDDKLNILQGGSKSIDYIINEIRDKNKINFREFIFNMTDNFCDFQDIFGNKEFSNKFTNIIDDIKGKINLKISILKSISNNLYNILEEMKIDLFKFIYSYSSFCLYNPNDIFDITNLINKYENQNEDEKRDILISIENFFELDIDFIFQDIQEKDIDINLMIKFFTSSLNNIIDKNKIDDFRQIPNTNLKIVNNELLNLFINDNSDITSLKTISDYLLCELKIDYFYSLYNELSNINLKEDMIGNKLFFKSKKDLRDLSFENNLKQEEIINEIKE